MAAAGTKLQGNAADKHDGSQSAKTAGVNAERNRRYENNECFVCCKQGHKQNGTAPKASRARRGKTVMARATARPPSSSNSSSNPRAVPLSVPGGKPPGRPLCLPPLRLELVATRPPQKQWLREPNLLHLRRPRRRMTTTCTFACRGRRWRQWIPGAPRRCSTMVLRELGRKMPRQSFDQFRCSYRHPRRSSGLELSLIHI